MTKRVMVVFGTRPECVKLAPVITALKSRSTDFETIVCASGQHRELLSQAVHAFGLSVDVDLAVMQPRQTLADLTGTLIAGLGRTMDEVKPDWVVVQGDTTTAFSAALAAYYARTRVAHVEAGLRTGDLVLSIDGADLGRDPQALVAALGERVGKPVKIAFKRGGKDQTVDLQVGTRSDSTYKVSELASATPDQLRIREAWLKTGK